MPPQMEKFRYAYLRWYLLHIVAVCEISESAVAYLCRKLYIGSRKKTTRFVCILLSPWYVGMWPRTMLYICKIDMMAIWCRIFVYGVICTQDWRYTRDTWSIDIHTIWTAVCRYVLRYERYVRERPGVRYTPYTWQVREGYKGWSERRGRYGRARWYPGEDRGRWARAHS